MKKCSFLVWTLLFLLPLASSAQSRISSRRSDAFWTSLRRMPSGVAVLVEKTDGDWMKGKLVGADFTTLTLQRNQRLVDLNREDVARIWRFTGRKIAKGAWIGAVIGTISGAVAFGSICHDEGAERALCLMVTISMGGLLGAGGGAGIGAVVGSTVRGRRLIYESEARGNSGFPRSRLTATPESRDSGRQTANFCLPEQFRPGSTAKPCRPFNPERSLERAAHTLARKQSEASLAVGR